MRVIRWSALAAAMVVGLSVALMLPESHPVIDPPPVVAAVTVNMGDVMAQSSYAMQRPLDDEAQRLADDTRAAAQFAMNTLPTLGLCQRPFN